MLWYNQSMEKMNPSSSDEIEVNPASGMLVSHGHEYLDIPRMREFIKKANKIRENLPDVQQGNVRLWRGNRPEEVGKNPSFTNSLEGIALPFLEVYGGKLSYVDVPKEELSKYLQTSAVAKDSEFILSEELASMAKVIE